MYNCTANMTVANKNTVTTFYDIYYSYSYNYVYS